MKDEGFNLLYNRFENKNKNDLEECESVILDRNTMDIVSYS